MPGVYRIRTREFVYDVSVTKDEQQPLSYRYCAHLSHMENIHDGQSPAVSADVSDAFGPTVTDAMRVLADHVDTWRRSREASPR